jgi:diguanylate cyclase
MKSIRPLMQTAQHVSDHKAYNLRFPQNNIREFQELNDVFNQLLKEIQCWHNDLQHQNHVLSFEARHDYLTGLPNRNYFYQKLHHLFDHTQHSQHAVMFFIDNNHFKSINDTYGHLAGDAVLMEMATRLKQKLRPDDFIARLGGDEFAIIVESVTQIEQIQSMAERLLETSHTPLYFKGQSICFSFSLGIAFSQFAHGPEEFISQADQAMYTAKGLAQQWFIYKP